MQAENDKLTQEVQTQKAELSEFKSVRNQLNIGSIMAENQQLKAFKEKVLRFIEKLGLKEQFDKFMKGSVDKER